MEFLFDFIQRRRFRARHADTMTDALGAVDGLIATLDQLAVGDAREFRYRRVRLHDVETKLNDIASHASILLLLLAGWSKDSHARDVAIITFIAGAEVGDHAIAFIDAAVGGWP